MWKQPELVTFCGKTQQTHKKWTAEEAAGCVFKSHTRLNHLFTQLQPFSVRKWDFSLQNKSFSLKAVFLNETRSSSKGWKASCKNLCVKNVFPDKNHFQSGCFTADTAFCIFLVTRRLVLFTTEPSAALPRPSSATFVPRPSFQLWSSYVYISKMFSLFQSETASCHVCF